MPKFQTSVWLILWITQDYAAAATVCKDFLVTPLEARILKVDFPNLQDIFITIKCCLGIFLVPFLKTRWPPQAFSTFSKEFCWHSRRKGITGRDFKFAGYVQHYKILTGNIRGLVLKNKMATMGGFFFSHEKYLYLPYY